jgi:hypothetical protein
VIAKASALLIPVFLLMAAPAPAEIAIAPPETKLPERERFVFRVKWLGMSVGEITATINGIKKINGRDAYALEASAKTNGLLAAVYPVNDRYVSYMDTERLYTLRHEVYRREGRYKKDAVTDFDQAAGMAYFVNFLDGSKKTVKIPPGVQDSLTAAYYFRMIPVELGRKVEFKVYNNERVYDLFGVADDMRFIRLSRLGRRAAFHIQPYARLEGDVVKRGRASGYFSCDSKRVPLAVSVRGPVFTEVTGYLAGED